MADHKFIFGGADSSTYGIYISGEGVFNAPERAVEMISIPGRNGAIALDQGRFENIEVTYPAFNYEQGMSDFSSNLAGLRSALCSKRGYQRLTDTIHPDEFRLGVYRSGLEVTPVKYNTASDFNITFDCKPQRFLTSGETEVDGNAWSNVQTGSGSIVTIGNADGDIGFKSLVADIEPIQSGSGTPSPTNVRPISGRDSVVVAVSPTSSVYDGKAYSSALGRTVYKGTLDLSTGLLTVTHGVVQFTGANRSGAINSSYYAYNTREMPSDIVTTTYPVDAYCDCYSVTASASGRVNGTFYLLNGNIIFVNDGFTSVADANTLMASQKPTVIYPLATPQTYQLTPEEVDLLLGTNNIWADSGDITVQYGNSPVYNPTEFDARPLIKVTGTGTVVVGDTAITITGTAGQTIYIDCDSMEIYTLNGGTPQSAASLVSFSGNDFPKLKAGSNTVALGTGITSVTITPRWWII